MTDLERTPRVRLLHRAGVAAWLCDAEPGTRVAVSYSDDEVDHERILVWPASLVHWFVLSPDDDCWVVDLSARSARDGPSGVECPVRIERGSRDRRLYRFREDVSREKLLRLMKNADKEPLYMEPEPPSAAHVGGLRIPLWVTGDGEIMFKS